MRARPISKRELNSLDDSEMSDEFLSVTVSKRSRISDQALIKQEQAEESKERMKSAYLFDECENQLQEDQHDFLNQSFTHLSLSYCEIENEVDQLKVQDPEVKSKDDSQKKKEDLAAKKQMCLSIKQLQYKQLGNKLEKPECLKITFHKALVSQITRPTNVDQQGMRVVKDVLEGIRSVDEEFVILFEKCLEYRLKQEYRETKQARRMQTELSMIIAQFMSLLREFQNELMSIATCNQLDDERKIHKTTQVVQTMIKYWESKK